MNDGHGQATVELALLLPVLALMLLAVVQIGLIAGDRVLTVNAARAAARAVAVRPDPATARAAARLALPGRAVRVVLDGQLRPGGLATVSVVTRAHMVPIVGRLLPAVELRERLTVRVEGG